MNSICAFGIAKAEQTGIIMALKFKNQGNIMPNHGICPKCYENDIQVAIRNHVQSHLVCRRCNHSWIERSDALKHHRNQRLGKLEDIEEVLLKRRYEKLDQHFNEGKIDLQEYVDSLTELEDQTKSVKSTLATFLTKRL